MSEFVDFSEKEYQIIRKTAEDLHDVLEEAFFNIPYGVHCCADILMNVNADVWERRKKYSIGEVSTNQLYASAFVAMSATLANDIASYHTTEELNKNVPSFRNDYKKWSSMIIDDNWASVLSNTNSDAVFGFLGDAGEELVAFASKSIRLGKPIDHDFLNKFCLDIAGATYTETYRVSLEYLSTMVEDDMMHDLYRKMEQIRKQTQDIMIANQSRPNPIRRRTRARIFR